MALTKTMLPRIFAQMRCPIARRGEQSAIQHPVPKIKLVALHCALGATWIIAVRILTQIIMSLAFFCKKYALSDSAKRETIRKMLGDL